MSLLNTFYTYGVLPATDPLCRGLGARLRHWRQRERLSLEENRVLQWSAVTAMLAYAYQNSPFYTERFRAAGLVPADIRRPEDLGALPPISRADLKTSLEQIRAHSIPPHLLHHAATGGTTETPVPVIRDRAALKEKRSIQEAFSAWAGLRPGTPAFYLWGARGDFVLNPGWKWRLYDQVLMRRRWLPTSRLNPQVFEDYRTQLNALRPRIIVAYPTPLQLFCEFLEQCGRPFWRPQAVICTAEALLPEARAIIERTLGCRVFERYATRDFGTVAAECEQHAGLHLNPAAAYIEFVPVAGAPPDGPRELLVTDLLNHGMPLIRYRVNDCVAADAPAPACPCGRGYPLIPPILGRSGDVLRLPDGSLIPGVALNRMPRVAPGIAKIQIIQEAAARFTLRFVPASSFAPSDIECARQSLAKFFPPETHWEFEKVAEIPREASGKTRFCINRMPQA